MLRTLVPQRSCENWAGMQRIREHCYRAAELSTIAHCYRAAQGTAAAHCMLRSATEQRVPMKTATEHLCSLLVRVRLCRDVYSSAV